MANFTIMRNGLNTEIAGDPHIGQSSEDVTVAVKDDGTYSGYAKRLYYSYCYHNELHRALSAVNSNNEFIIPVQAFFEPGMVKLSVELSNGTNCPACNACFLIVTDGAKDVDTSVLPSEKTWQSYIQSYLKSDVDALEKRIDNLILSKADKTALDAKADKTTADALGKRIDNLILHSGTESSAEIVDARTGYDGTAYDTLGTAIRKQVSELNESIVEISDAVGYTNPKRDMPITWEQGSFAYSGTTFTLGSSEAFARSDTKHVVEAGTIIHIDVKDGFLCRVDAFADLDITNGTCSNLRNNSGYVSGIGNTYTVMDGITNLMFRSCLSDKVTACNYNDIANAIDIYTIIDGTRKPIDRIVFLENDNVENKSKISKLEDSAFKSLYCTVGIFNSIGAIGDSYTQGAIYNESGSWVGNATNQTFIATMAKRAGVSDVSNYGHGGTNTRTYLTSSEMSNVISDGVKELYTFCFGINDLEQLGVDYIGSVSDIHDSDYSQNADTFYGNYGKIIQMVREHAPNSKMVLIGAYKPDTSTKKYSLFNVETKKIAQYFGIPYIEPTDDDYFTSDFFTNDIVKGHPTRIGYVGAGIAFERLFSKCVKENESYFMYLD